MSELLARIEARCVAEMVRPDLGECLVWTGTRLPKGYGQISVAGKKRYVHRLAWIERHGEIPRETPHVLHHCDNPPCIADEHLYAGTNADNGRDAWARLRSHPNACPVGHRYDEANSGLSSKGSLYCRTCQRSRNRLGMARRRLAARASGLGKTLQPLASS